MSKSGSKRRSRARYSKSAVRFVLSFERFTARVGIAHVVYALVGFPFWLYLKIVVMWRNHIEIIGQENFSKDQGYFLLCNHRSMGEAPLLAAHMFPWTPFWFPAKAEFFKNWFVSLVFMAATACHAFPVRRGERDFAAIRLIETLLKKGDNILLFPEGSRSPDGRLQKGKKGVGMIIHNARPQVLPVYAEGFEEIWPPGTFIPYRGGRRALIVYGEPIDLQRYYEEPLSTPVAQGIVDDVMDAIGELQKRYGTTPPEPADSGDESLSG